MATNLYEILEISANATGEEVRRAYRKKALQTHPDRLPPTATAEQKAASEELFRKVNNAYEVLSNTQNRQAYDLHGVWPPPQAGASQMPNGRGSFDPFSNPAFRGNDPFSHPFFSSSNGRDPFVSFGFTNPFALFDSIFGYDSQHHTFRGSHARGHGIDPFAQMEADLNHLFNAMQSPPMAPPQFGGFPGFPGFINIQNANPAIMGGPRSSSSSRSWGFGGGFSSNGGGWSASESYSTTTINGVTQSVHKKRDTEGNEHVTIKYPDGREVYMLNGIEQSSISGGQQAAGRITQGSTQPQSSGQRHHDHRRSGSRSSTMPQNGVQPPPYSRSDYEHSRNHRHPSRRHTEDHHRRSSRDEYPEPTQEPSQTSQEDHKHPEQEHWGSWFAKWLPSIFHHQDHSSDSAKNHSE